MRWMNLEHIIQGEVSQKESYTNVYTWNVERQYWWTYLQGSTDLWMWGEEGEGGIYGESNMETYIIICKTDSQWEFSV